MSPNRLINEKSPYLLMHANNPVDWYPWTDEAFEKARLEDKPVFLSIGYSSCHWCHVMERESFNDPEIASILNRHFVSVKVDREERPDIDSIYMKACLLFQMQGGWPLTVFLKPDKTPFYADTYIPKEDRYGKMGLKNLLLLIASLWSGNRKSLEDLSEKVKDGLVRYLSAEKEVRRLSTDTLHKAYYELRREFDEEHKGFGNSPKFPMPLYLLFLHRYHHRFNSKEALFMSLETLERMRMGGIYDHVGYGFHRYSTDREWRIPHFEKMLYDNALLQLTYTEAYQLSENRFFIEVAEEIASYLLRDMLDPLGAFYTSEDAETGGIEGSFYTWTYDELKKALNRQDFEFLEKIFMISREGNFRDEESGRSGLNVLSMRKPLSSLSPPMLSRLSEIRKKLFSLRMGRERPFKDRKILTDWNSLAIVSFSRLSVVSQKKEYLEVAEKALSFILDNLLDTSGRLYHGYSGGQRFFPAFIEDYAYLIWALTEVYFLTLKEEYLKIAVDLTGHVLKHFLDKDEGGFYHTPDYSEAVLFRMKENYDGVTPSGASVMAFNLIRLHSITKKEDYRLIFQSSIENLSKRIDDSPLSYIFWLICLDLYMSGMTEVTVSYPSSRREDVQSPLKEIQRYFHPDLVVIPREGGSDEYPMVGDKPTYYVCKNFSCRSPVTDLEGLKELL